MCNRFLSLIIPLKRGLDAYSSEGELNKLILQVECLFYNLSS